MGGLVVRKLYEDTERFDPHIDATIMIFPPNQGALKADTWQNKWWYRLGMGPAGQELTAAVAQLTGADAPGLYYRRRLAGS